MAVGTILRIFVIVAGVFMLGKAVLSLAKRKMTEPFCLAWAVLSVLLIISGILLDPSQLDPYISTKGLVLIILIVSGCLWGAWFISAQVAMLKRKNQELAMQISLLNQDYETILRELEGLKKNQ